MLEVLQEKLSKLLSGDDIKSIQKIALSLGHICSNETSFSHLKIALDLLFSLSRSKVGLLILFAKPLPSVLFIRSGRVQAELSKPLNFVHLLLARLKKSCLPRVRRYLSSGVVYQLLLI